MSSSAESVLEDATLTWLERLGYQVLHGPAIALNKPDYGLAARIAGQT